MRHASGTPLAVVQPSTITVNKGKHLRLVCATSSPDHFNTYSWRFPTYINSQSKSHVTTKRELVISNVTVEQEGDYHCKATNSKGFAEINFHVNVRGVCTMMPCTSKTLTIHLNSL